MSEKSYSDKLKSPKWQKKRLEIMRRDKFRCRLCKDEETQLSVHHKEYINGNEPWDYDNSYLVTLCEHCHKEVELLRKEEIPFDKIRIYKSVGWNDKSIIMFVSYFDTCSMSIYNRRGEMIIGFNLVDDIPPIISILKNTLKNG